jgi:phenolic acid decarboxylase
MIEIINDKISRNLHQLYKVNISQPKNSEKYLQQMEKKKTLALMLYFYSNVIEDPKVKIQPSNKILSIKTQRLPTYPPFDTISL